MLQRQDQQKVIPHVIRYECQQAVIFFYNYAKI